MLTVYFVFHFLLSNNRREIEEAPDLPTWHSKDGDRSHSHRHHACVRLPWGALREEDYNAGVWLREDYGSSRDETVKEE